VEQPAKKDDWLRDQFAAAALTGYLAAFTGKQVLPDEPVAAEASYRYADAMLAERRRGKGTDNA
jgi:hypothetical protein